MVARQRKTQFDPRWDLAADSFSGPRISSKVDYFPEFLTNSSDLKIKPQNVNSLITEVLLICVLLILYLRTKEHFTLSLLFAAICPTVHFVTLYNVHYGAINYYCMY